MASWARWAFRRSTKRRGWSTRGDRAQQASRREAHARRALLALWHRSLAPCPHGALLDAQLLAQVYVELMGGRQIGLGLLADTSRGQWAGDRRPRARQVARRARSGQRGGTCRPCDVSKGYKRISLGGRGVRLTPRDRPKDRPIRVHQGEDDGYPDFWSSGRNGRRAADPCDGRLQGIAEKYFARAISSEV